MDLTTVRTNVENDKYSTVEACLDDIQLIWDNCKLYNVEFSQIYKMAVRLEGLLSKLVEQNFSHVKEYGKENPSYKSLQKAKGLLPKNDVVVEEYWSSKK